MNKFTLLADVGNTTMKLGIADEHGIVHSFGFPSKSLYTADSLGFNIIQLLDLYHIEKIESVSLCSVVPELGKFFAKPAKIPALRTPNFSGRFQYSSEQSIRQSAGSGCGQAHGGVCRPHAPP